MQTDTPPAYRYTAEIRMPRADPQLVEMTYVMEDSGLSVTHGQSVRLIPWTSLRFLHLHVTSGVGATGFPVYTTRLRTRFATREISSLDRQGETAVDRSADYVRFMEELIPFAAARNPSLRLRHAGDPMVEGVIPMALSLLVMPLLLIPFLVIKLPLGAMAIVGKKPVAKLLPWVLSAGFGAVLNALPWSSGKPFGAYDLPIAELPLKYRRGGA